MLRATVVVEDDERRIGWDQVILNRISGTQTGDYSQAYLLDIGTSNENIAFGDITPGYLVMYNLDDTNFVSYGFAATNKHGRLQPKRTADDECGLPNIVYLNGGTNLHLEADTAACKVRIIAYEA